MCNDGRRFSNSRNLKINDGRRLAQSLEPIIVAIPAQASKNAKKLKEITTKATNRAKIMMLLFSIGSIFMKTGLGDFLGSIKELDFISF